MARTFARVKASVWADPDWRTLTVGAQWAYVLLISQPQINNCGVLPYLPLRWSRLANGTTPDWIRHTLAELAHANFITVDEHAGEVLIRSFVKHDKVEEQPNLKTAAMRQYGEIESDRIRWILAAEYPDLFTFHGPEPEPLPLDLPEGVPKPLPEGVPARGACRLQTVDGRQQHRARARDPEPLNGQPDAAAAELEHRLRTLGWSGRQLAQGLAAADLAAAWATKAALEATDNAGGYAWAGFQTGTFPDEGAAPGALATIAPGAQGPRSQRQPFDLERAAANLVAGGSWDETTDEASIREELQRAASAHGVDVPKASMDAFVQSWAAEYERRYPDSDPEPVPKGAP